MERKDVIAIVKKKSEDHETPVLIIHRKKVSIHLI